MSLADPALSLIGTTVLAFVIGEFVLPDLVRNRLGGRLWSLPVYAAAVVWALSPARLWLAPALVGALAGCDLLGARKGLPASEMVWRYAVVGLRVAVVCAFITLAVEVLPASRPGLSLPTAAVRAMLWSAAYLFVLPGGTALVRYALDAVSPAWGDQVLLPQARPPLRTAPQSLPGGVGVIQAQGGQDARPEIAAAADAGPAVGEAAELRRGRVIGNVERLIVTTLVCLGQYGAIGLVVAAKSLARFPQLSESRNFAEYYLIGTLVSMAVAIGTGLALTSALVRL